MPLGAANNGVHHDMVSVRLFNGKSDKIGERQRGETKNWKKHEWYSIEKEPGKVVELTRKGRCHGTRYQKDLSKKALGVKGEGREERVGREEVTRGAGINEP